MIFGRSIIFVLSVATFLPHFISGQNRFGESMSYSVVNGKVYIDPPTTTTTETSFMETWFPFLSSSYTSSNPEEIDEAILNSVTGPPEQSISLHQNYGMPSSYSQYQQQPQQSYSNSQSPYLSNDEDNYIPSGSVNVPQHVAPDGGMFPSQNGGYPNQNYIQNQYHSAMPPLPYPFSPLPGQTSTERSVPFYQPILDFFGFGSTNEEQLPIPFPGGQYAPSFPTNSYQFATPQFAQARNSNEDENVKYVDTYEGKYSADIGPKSDNLSVKDEKVKDEKENPCPKLGFYHWNGDVCIAVGPVPIWACRPNDLVISGRIGICRNKIFFPPGTNPLGNK